MANFSSPAAFTAEIGRLQADMERHYPDWGRDIGREAQAEGYRAAAADLGGDPKFSGWRPWLELRVVTKPYGAALLPTRYSAGPWTVAEFGRNTNAGFTNIRRTRSGDIKTLKSGRVSVRRRKRWNGVTVGKSTASDAQARFDALAEKSAEKNYRVTLRRHFD